MCYSTLSLLYKSRWKHFWNLFQLNNKDTKMTSIMWFWCQGLKQKEKAHINCEKGAQISILANKIETRWWPNIIIKESKQTIHYIYFLFSRYVHIMLLIWWKKLELRLMAVLVLLKIESGHAQISVPKIGIRMTKTTCINPWVYLLLTLNRFHSLLFPLLTWNKQMTAETVVWRCQENYIKLFFSSAES